MRFLFVVEPLSEECPEWLGVMYLSSVLKKYNLETKLFVTGENVEEIIAWKPDFIGYSASTGRHRNLQKFNSELKKRINFVSVFGGPHPTYFPEIASDKDIDYIVRGEAEEVIATLLSQPKEKIILGKLPWDLDKIPFPDRDLIYSHKSNPIRRFIATRGCPFDCPYCYNSAARKLYPGEKWVRFRSPENVLEEIDYVLKQYNGKFVFFQDDCFGMNKPWLEKFLSIYKQKINLPFHCKIRLDSLEENMVKDLKEANCYSVRWALECGNDDVRVKILKRKMTKQQIISGTQLLHKYGIKFMLLNMLCLPETGIETDLETLELNIQCHPTFGWSSIFQPYPGTELSSYFPNITVDKIIPSYFADSPLDISDKKLRVRLQRLFGVITRYPSLRYLLPLLLRLPLDSFYYKLWDWHYDLSNKKLYAGVI
jgi:radical SAM superfamily enzyme YgiQ (UPF0313 family)